MEPPLPDGVLDGIRRRDPDAFAACYEALADPLYRYLRHRCDDPTLAEDLVEATFLELVEQAPALVGGPRAVRAWLFRAGRNNLLDAVRKERRHGDVSLDESTTAAYPGTDPDPAQAVVAGDHAQVLREALLALSPDQREVLALRFFAELTGPEVAAVTGRSLNAIKALQHRGVRALERVLRDRGVLHALSDAVTTRNQETASRAEQADGNEAEQAGGNETEA